MGGPVGRKMISFECAPITDAAVMEAARSVRRQVFIEEQGVPEAEEWDTADAAAVHFALRSDGTVMGTARLIEEDGGWWRVGRVAVLPAARGRGGGRRLMETAVAFARARGARGIVLDAQVPVIPFYERLGFVAEGEPFMEAGIPHRRMSRQWESA